MIVLILAITIPPVIRDNTAAQILFSLLITAATTGISAFITIKYAKRQSQDELTRYGLQAYRNLNNLAVKISEQVSAESENDTRINNQTLMEWQLDIDQAKQSWQDLMREVFELQSRMDLETAEITQEYELRIAKSTTLEERLELRRERDLAVAKRAARAPLPVPVLENVNCPHCNEPVVASIGTHRGDSARPTCTSCHNRFNLHRQVDGSLTYGGGLAGSAQSLQVTGDCPVDDCQAKISFSIPEDRAVTFETSCQLCETHIEFRGTSSNFSLTDLGKTNENYDCPYCNASNDVWVAPGRSVRFRHRCATCQRTTQIAGALGSLEAERFEESAQSPPRADDVKSLSGAASNALAAGDLERARELYVAAGNAGLNRDFLTLDLSMIEFAEKDYEKCIEDLHPLSSSSMAMQIQAGVLTAMAKTAGGSEPDLDSIKELLSNYSNFRLEKSGLRFLIAFLRNSGALSDALQSVIRAGGWSAPQSGDPTDNAASVE